MVSLNKQVNSRILLGVVTNIMESKMTKDYTQFIVNAHLIKMLMFTHLT